ASTCPLLTVPDLFAAPATHVCPYASAFVSRALPCWPCFARLRARSPVARVGEIDQTSRSRRRWWTSIPPQSSSSNRKRQGMPQGPVSQGRGLPLPPGRAPRGSAGQSLSSKKAREGFAGLGSEGHSRTGSSCGHLKSLH